MGDSRILLRQLAVLALAGAVLSGCEKAIEVQAPPRSTTKAVIPREYSTIDAPIVVPLADIQAALERAAPKVLWTINQREEKCVPAQRVLKGKILGVKLFGAKGLKVTPDLGCQIVGRAVRGPIALTGKGKTLQMTMPVSAIVQVRNVGGVLTHETATGAVAVRANVRLGMRPDWTPTAKLDISYNWTNPPGIDLLGRRITFIKQADARLAGVVVGLEKSLPRELAKLNVRPQVAQVWRSGFATILLNRDKPPAWMRITPQKLGLTGYRADKRTVTLGVAAQLLTETFIGPRPPDPQPTPLPSAATGLKQHGLVFSSAVIADYAQLEPVILRALQKRAAKGITLKDIGPVDAVFDKVTVYGTDGGRVAVGVDLTATVKGKPGTKTRATAWLTGKLYNESNSRTVRVRDLAISADTSRKVVNIAIRLFTEPSLVGTIEDALVEDFSKEYDRVIAAARKAIAERRQGDVTVTATITSVQSGQIEATGEGLVLPVKAFGEATIRYRPRR